MDWKREGKILALITVAFLLCFTLPVEWLQQSQRLGTSFWEALYLVRWYAREHVILCLVPAFFIAGGIATFVSQGSVMKYLGAGAKKIIAYPVAAVSGTILAVCSCTVLPLFSGIYRMGAGLGPATAFLYSGPAINVLAIILTARILGPGLGLARAVGAIIFSIVIGLLMDLIFHKDEQARVDTAAMNDEPARPLWQNALFFAVLLGILVFANWGRPREETGLWWAVFNARWFITAALGAALAIILATWFGHSPRRVILASIPAVILAVLFPHEPMIPFIAGVLGLSFLTATDPGESGEWFENSWTFAKQILPLLLMGVIIAGFLLGRPGEEGLIPADWVARCVGGNSLGANLFASLIGAFMYFATLTEVPILQGLIGNGMGNGPALALLLAGPALSLPNMLVIRSVLGTKKTAVFVTLVVIMATLSGMLYGAVFG